MNVSRLVSALEQAVGVIEVARANGAWDHESTDEQDSIDEVNTVLQVCEEALQRAGDKRTHLTFEEAMLALEQSSFTIAMHPMNGEPIVIEHIGWEEEGDEDSDFVVSPEGCDGIYMSRKDTFEITSDGRGFTVPGHSLMLFPNKPFNFRV